MQTIVNETTDYLQSPRFLVFPDFTEPFILHCDASEKGLGAVLYQKREGKPRVISYASRTLTDPERNYHLHSGKLEFLALKWAVTERFSDYLCYGAAPFTVFTDNNPLTYVMSTAKLNATGLRWVAELANYQFIIRYKPGKLNGDADGLSRVCGSESSDPLEALEKECTAEMDPNKLSMVMSTQRESSVHPPCLPINVNLLQLDQTGASKMIGKESLKEAQMKDSVVGPVYDAVLKGNKVRKSKLSKKSLIILKQFRRLRIEDGLLKRILKDRKQLVLPDSFHNLVFLELHAKMGHLGSDRVEELCRQRFYWPQMRAEIEDFIQKKCTCIASKK